MSEIRSRKLTPQQIQAFHDRGYVVLRRLFDRVEIGQMRGAFDRLARTARRLDTSGLHRGAQFVVDRSEGRTRIKRIVWCGAAEPVLSRYGMDPRLLAPAAQLLGSVQMQQLINQAHFKFPGDRVTFPWHQDSAHRRYGGPEWNDVNGKGSYVQTVVAVDPVTEANAPLQFIPGSGRRGHVSRWRNGVHEIPPDLIDDSRAVAPLMEPGDVLLFGPYVFHSSGENHSSRPRRVFINGFAYPGANSRVYPGEGAGRLVRAP